MLLPPSVAPRCQKIKMIMEALFQVLPWSHQVLCGLTCIHRVPPGLTWSLCCRALLSCSISPGNVMTPLWRECAAQNPDAEAVIREGETWQVGPAGRPRASWVKRQRPADRQTVGQAARWIDLAVFKFHPVTLNNPGIAALQLCSSAWFQVEDAFTDCQETAASS